MGAGAYVLATTTIGLSVRTSLMSFAFLPLVMLVAFFVVLPLEPLRMSVQKKSKAGGYQSVGQNEEDDGDGDGDGDEGLVPDHEDPTLVEHEGLLATSLHSTRSFKPLRADADEAGWSKFKSNLHRASRLFFP